MPSTNGAGRRRLTPMLAAPPANSTDARSGPLILDGWALAQARRRHLRERVDQMVESRCEAPRLLLLAFEGADGAARGVAGKVTACTEVGVEVQCLVLPYHTDTDGALFAVQRALPLARPDAVFMQLPFPPGVDSDRLADCIPPGADIDVMGPGSFRDFLEGRLFRPPLASVAMIALLEAGEIPLMGQVAAVVGEKTPGNWMLRRALEDCGVRVTLVSPGSPDLAVELETASVVLTGAARPGVISSRLIAPGSVVLDGGYFNPGGRGDVDVSAGIAHLGAFAPVPGGVGPMMVSALAEAVISRASWRRSDGQRRAPV